MAFDIREYIEKNKIKLGKIKKSVGTTPYKGGYNDIRKTNYDVRLNENGELDLYTHSEVEVDDEVNEARYPISAGTTADVVVREDGVVMIKHENNFISLTNKRQIANLCKILVNVSKKL